MRDQALADVSLRAARQASLPEDFGGSYKRNSTGVKLPCSTAPPLAIA